jgi:hypothetical protein
MSMETRTRRPLLALLDAVSRHPGAALAVTVVLWLLDRLLS